MLPWLAALTALAGDGAPAQSALLSGAVDAPAALALLEAQGPEASSAEDVQYALEHGWWEPAKHMLRTMRERGDAVTTMQSVRTTATRIRDEATEVINLLRVSTPPPCRYSAATAPPQRRHSAATATPALPPHATSALPQRCLSAASALPRLRHCPASAPPTPCHHALTTLPPRRRHRVVMALRLVSNASIAPRRVRARVQVGANKEETVVNCAFQWAQRPDFIYLNVKYSSRCHALTRTLSLTLTLSLTRPLPLPWPWP